MCRDEDDFHINHPLGMTRLASPYTAYRFGPGLRVVNTITLASTTKSKDDFYYSLFEKLN